MRGLLLGRSFFFLYRKSPNHVVRGPVSYSVVCARLKFWKPAGFQTFSNRSRSGEHHLQRMGFTVARGPVPREFSPQTKNV